MDGGDNVMLAWFKFLILVFSFLFIFLFRCRFGGSGPLAVASRVDFLGFFGLSGEFVNLFNVYEVPVKVVAFPGGLNPCMFCLEYHGSM